MARRTTPCPRNLDDVLRLSVVGLSMSSLGLTFCAMLVFVGLELLSGVFSLLFGHWGMSTAFLATLLVGAALRQAEQYDDHHFVPSLILFYLLRGDGWRVWREVVLSPLAPDATEDGGGAGLDFGFLAMAGALEMALVFVQAATHGLTRRLGQGGTAAAFLAPLALVLLRVRWAQLEAERVRMVRIYRAHAALEEEAR